MPQAKIKIPANCSNNGNGNENKHLGNGDYFVIIVSSSHPLLLTEHAANGLGSAVEVNIENERFTIVCSRCR